MLTDSQIEDVISKVIESVLIPKFKELKMNATGNWIEKTKADGNTIIGPHYTKYLVEGRAPGKNPPIAPIESWVQAKLGLSGKQATSVAYAISHKIAKEGTSWYQAGGSDLLEILESKEVYEMFVKLYAIEVKAIISDNFRRAITN